VTKKGFVFNNLVRFAEGGVAPLTKIPAHVLDQSRLTVDGLGPLTFDGQKSTNYRQRFLDWYRLGYVVKSDPCDFYCSAGWGSR